MSPLTTESRASARDIVGELMMVSERLKDLDFPHTLKAFDDVLTEFGFELAEREAFTKHGKKVADDLARVHEIYRRERSA